MFQKKEFFSGIRIDENPWNNDPDSQQQFLKKQKLFSGLDHFPIGKVIISHKFANSHNSSGMKLFVQRI